MSKMMSVFEKLNLVEKVDAKTISNSDVQKDNIHNEKDMREVQDYMVENEIEYENNKSNNHNLDQKNKFQSNMTIDEIYSTFDLANSDINTIFMLGNFINALPENLPYDVKKKTVMNIINASKTDLNKLVADGEKRLSVLKKFSDDFYTNIESSVSNYNSEIAKLSALIESHKEQINIKTTMLEEQNHIIKYEAQKINSIIDFFSNGE
jgi:hypothetical protein